MEWLVGEAAARIPLDEGAVLDLIWQQFGELDLVNVTPNIPTRKELVAQRTHVAHLPWFERILAFYEAPRQSGLSGAVVHEGFLFTSERICWRNASGPARGLAWSALDPERLILDGSRLFVTDDADEAIVIVEPEVRIACADALHVLALSCQAQARDGQAHIDDMESGVVRRVDSERPDTVPPGSLAETVPPPAYDWDRHTGRHGSKRRW